MVMYRNNISLQSQEDIGYELGLTVPKEDAHLFNKVRTGKKPSAGWGTQIQKPEFDINRFFEKFNIPYEVERFSIKDLPKTAALKNKLQEIEAAGHDALLCFDYGILWGVDHKGGHVCIFDKLSESQVHIIDPERNVPKFRVVSLERLHQAIRMHGVRNACGVWEIRPK